MCKQPSPTPSPARSGSTDLLQNILFGGVAGVIGQFSVYPLYTIRTHLQLHPTQYTNFVQGGLKIFRDTGFRSLYRGLRPALTGVFPEKAIKLSVNDYLTAVLSRPDGSISMPHAMLAGAGAGLTQVIATNPMEVLMINMQTSTLSMQRLVSKLGVSGLYKHVSATLLRDIPFSMVFFPMNTYLRRALTNNDGTLPTHKVFLAGILSGSTAAITSTPADVIKTNLQSVTSKTLPAPPASATSAAAPASSSGPHTIRPGAPSSQSSRLMSSSSASSAPKPAAQQPTILQCAKSIYATRGVRGFFAGVGPRILTVSPLFGVTMFVYEVQRRLKESGTL